MSNILSLSQITRHYGEGPARVDVLNGVDFTLTPGEAVAIVGPSGSGKSTLMHIAGLLDTPDTGTVQINGQNTKGLNDSQLSKLRNNTFGFVYQHHHLLREFTALENVLLPARIGGVPASQNPSTRASQLLTAVGLGHRLNHYPSQLSGGEQQRVAIARALMNQPKVLLADEPTGNLDPHTADDVTDMLFNLVKTENLALLLVTHNPALAARCHRTLTMREGRLA
jgi:lipoprotein-releasing system ATP-binding protein